MVMAIETLTRLCPGILFDWRLYAERGSPRYFHHHPDGRRIDECELEFINKMSDDERLSLTTAISDDDDGETRDSPYRAKSGAAAAAFQCTGAVRKAGFLSVKKWLLRKRHQVELARKRGWKGYWVCLKGTTLLFYPCDSRDGRAIESKPRHLIIIDGAIMQPIPEHPKRDFIFCLSTAFGDAYLFQAPCQIELENWIAAIHNACGSAFARHRGKTGTLHLLQEEIHRIEKQIESDSKLRHMAELQLTVIADTESRKQLQDQIRTYDENLEQFHCEQFRLRCYMTSIQSTELPNPKTLLAHVSKATKTTLNRLGVFTVSSFHAYICARSPQMLTNIISARGGTRRRGQSLTMQQISASTRSLSRHSSIGSKSSTGLSRSAELPNDKMIQIILPPDDQLHSVYLRGSETIEDLLWLAFADKQLSPNDYFIRCKRMKGDYFIPGRHEIVDHLPPYEMMEVCAKVLYQVELSRHSLDQLFGFSVEAELVENSADHHNQDELCVYVSRVEEGSLAVQQGLRKGDEIMVINGAIVSDLDMMYIESVLQEELSLCMMLRSCRTEPPDLSTTVRSTDEYIESLVCPPPPTDGHMSDEMIGKLIVPSPLWVQERNRTGGSLPGGQLNTLTTIAPPANTCLPLKVTGEQIAETLIKSAEQVTSEYCRTVHPPQYHHQQPPMQHQSSITKLTQQPQQIHQSQLQYHRPMTSILQQYSSRESSAPPSQHPSIDEADGQTLVKRPPLTDAEKLRKVIRELIDTERTYVEQLNSLLEIYLEPMKKQNLVSNADISLLFGNIQEIVAFQRQFLDSLEESVRNEDNFDRFNAAGQFKNVLFSIASKILHPSSELGQNPALIEFLNAASRGQHAYSFESYLIKPIQRILKYPLLLQQLKHLTESNSDEHKHLTQALKGMERVAEHINEMQRIHEEYGAIFDHLQRQHLKSLKTNIELNPAELLYYGGVEWVNIGEFLGKIKKGLDLHAMCFVFKMAVVFLCKERIRQKKKLVGVSNKVSEVEIIRYQVLIPVTEVQVRATSVRTEANVNSKDHGNQNPQYIWELIHLRCSQIGVATQRRTEKVYQLSNSTNEFRNAFLRTIRQIIRESVRKMAVPLTKPQTMSSKGQYQTANTSSITAQSMSTSSNDSPSGAGPGAASASGATSAGAKQITSSSSSQNNSTPQQAIASSSASGTGTTGSKTPTGEATKKSKPMPPPRAPTTTKTSNNLTTAQQMALKEKLEKEHHHHHHQTGSGKQTVMCALCGADVGLGPGESAAKSQLRTSPAPEASGGVATTSGERSEPSTSSGKGKRQSSGDILQRDDSIDEPNVSPTWKPREGSR